MKILKEGNELLDQSLSSFGTKNSSTTIFNSLGFERTEIVEVDTTASAQATSNGKGLVAVSVPAAGYVSLDSGKVDNKELSVCVGENDQGIILENSFVKVVFNKMGRLVSLFDKKADRDAIEKGKLANQFVIYDDVPMYWDAWYEIS